VYRQAVTAAGNALMVSDICLQRIIINLIKVPIFINRDFALISLVITLISKKY
jgi:hypothetical protein